MNERTQTPKATEWTKSKEWTELEDDENETLLKQCKFENPNETPKAKQICGPTYNWHRQEKTKPGLITDSCKPDL